ncbi:hypothetical protein L9G74_11710 [Shewanella sp. C32]|uniref:Uncharacterized protein n=1 Tax=Shewanella electrica TaxID=515560 RepID=A0ABT2FL91_9GAMM|nr:hypothetical protein [Shewanella electrica]MCH1925584.1 hypothetical protein [Shewanella electrica]MCS4557109.1 hypothetical protein [Shewanella electrica]
MAASLRLTPPTRRNQAANERNNLAILAKVLPPSAVVETSGLRHPINPRKKNILSTAAHLPTPP